MSTSGLAGSLDSIPTGAESIDSRKGTRVTISDTQTWEKEKKYVVSIIQFKVMHRIGVVSLCSLLLQYEIYHVLYALHIKIFLSML